jgi:hypothetical protein
MTLWPRAIRYRLSDNYLSFYLKYIAPRRSQIEKRLYQRVPLETLLAWDTIFGLQLTVQLHPWCHESRGRNKPHRDPCGILGSGAPWRAYNAG